jgi:hypothetical protein
VTTGLSAKSDARDRDRSYRQHIDQAIAGLGTDRRRGLCDDEARSRLGVYGRNELKPDPPVAAWRRFLPQFQVIYSSVLQRAFGTVGLKARDWLFCAAVASSVLWVRELTKLGAARHLLGGLLAFGALNAFAGGYYGLAGARGVPVEWLAGSPFDDYTIPSLVLFVVVGGSFLLAAVAVFARARIARASALTAGAVVLAWIAVQMAIIGYVSWMQPATATAGAVVLLLAAQLPASGASPRRQQ